MRITLSLLTVVTLLILFQPNLYADDMIKEPNVAGQFYQGNASLLSKHVKEMLSKADTKPLNKHISVLIVPHAGHIFSGPVAAHGFNAISQNKYKTIILLGPTHFFRFDGIATWPKGGFKTPLGVIQVDENFSKELMKQTDKVSLNAQVFERDHVLEVELPFLQTIFDDIKIVPLIMSRDVDFQTLNDLADALDTVIGDRDDVLLLISSDLSHYHDVKTANEIDSRGIKAVEEMDIEKLWKEHHSGNMEIDGFKEVITALLYAKKNGLANIKVLKYGNSGDASGDFNRVVGYMSTVIY